MAAARADRSRTRHQAGGGRGQALAATTTRRSSQWWENEAPALNAALHRIAITQLRLPGPGQSYYQRRRAQGDGTGEAVRALKRRIARAVYQHLKQAQQASVTATPPAA